MSKINLVYKTSLSLDKKLKTNVDIKISGRNTFLAGITFISYAKYQEWKVKLVREKNVEVENKHLSAHTYNARETYIQHT